MDLFKKISLQTVWQLIGKVITTLTTILILGIITRSYGREGTGIFTLVLAYLAFFYVIADFGINAHLMPKMLKNDASTWQRLLGLRIVWATVLMGISLLISVAWPVGDLFKWAVVAGFGTVIGSAVFTTTNLVFQSRLRYDLSVLALSIGTISTLIAIFLLTSWHFPVSWTLVGYTLGWFVTAVISLWLIRKIVPLLPVFDLSFIRQTIRESWPISLTLILNLVYFRIDAFLLTALKGFAEVGVYNLAFQIFQSVLVLPTYIMNGYYPLLLNKFENHRADFRRQLTLACLVMLALATAGVAATQLLAPWVIYTVTGNNDFAGAVVSLRILALSFPAFFVSAVLMWALIAYKKYRSMLVVYSIGLIFNITANYIFIPGHSYIASSWITAASEYLILILQLFILFKLR